jgi:hypothetical protein
MNAKHIQQIIQKNKHDIAFIIGNGINRYPDNPDALSWDELLIKLWEKVSLHTLSLRPDGISLTEFYDILDLENARGINLQNEVALLMKDWGPCETHKRIIHKILEINAPVLTTNFDETLAKTFDYNTFRPENESFTDFYPWSSYHGYKPLKDPCEGFAIWYINGMVHYRRSIRLGLSHYMGSVEHASSLLKGTGKISLYAGKANAWIGAATWLHIIFNKSLFIFGLGLDENETFLRWLLIERFKYFRKFPDRKHKAWYITKKNESSVSSGKKFFLEHVGIEVLELDSYEDIYETIWK